VCFGLDWTGRSKGWEKGCVGGESRPRSKAAESGNTQSYVHNRMCGLVKQRDQLTCGDPLHFDMINDSIFLLVVNVYGSMFHGLVANANCSRDALLYDHVTDPAAFFERFVLHAEL
jgi:hypothetical protein